jgi:hypothetical protein
MRNRISAFSAIALAAMLLPIALSGCSHPRYYAYYPPPSAATYTSVAREGFHDGADAARRDISAGKRPDPDRHPRFRNPPVPPPAWEDYRHEFRDGYRQVFENGGAPPPHAY